MSRSSLSPSSSSSSFDFEEERPVDDLLHRLVAILEKLDHTLEVIDNNPAVLSSYSELRRLFKEGELLVTAYELSQNAVPTVEHGAKPLGSLVRQSTLNEIRPDYGKAKVCSTSKQNSESSKSLEVGSKKDNGMA